MCGGWQEHLYCQIQKILFCSHFFGFSTVSSNCPPITDPLLAFSDPRLPWGQSSVKLFWSTSRCWRSSRAWPWPSSHTVFPVELCCPICSTTRAEANSSSVLPHQASLHPWVQRHPATSKSLLSYAAVRALYEPQKVQKRPWKWIHLHLFPYLIFSLYLK